MKMLLSRLILIHKNSILVLKNKCGILEYQKEEGCCIIISNLLRTPVGAWERWYAHQQKMYTFIYYKGQG